jgi:branched-chain amino acid aminotransferase
MLELVTARAMDVATSDARHGWGCFETLRVEKGLPRWLERHLARLAGGCAFLGLAPPPPPESIRAFLESLPLPGPDLTSDGDGTLRLIAVDGCLIVRLDGRPAPPAEPLRACLSTRVTRCSASPLNRFKTLSYLENRLLQVEAGERQAFEALALNESGRLTDGGRTTVLLRKRGRWLTPPAEDGALPGIARGLLLEAGLVDEAALRPEELPEAEGALLVNALRGVQVLSEVAGWASWQTEPPGLAPLREALA